MLDAHVGEFVSDKHYNLIKMKTDNAFKFVLCSEQKSVNTDLKVTTYKRLNNVNTEIHCILTLTSRCRQGLIHFTFEP